MAKGLEGIATELKEKDDETIEETLHVFGEVRI
jgi:hypothetical protein